METEPGLSIINHIECLIIIIVSVKVTLLWILLFLLIGLLAIIEGAEVAFATLSSTPSFKDEVNSSYLSKQIRDILAKTDGLMISFWIVEVLLKVLLLLYAVSLLDFMISVGFLSFTSALILGCSLFICIYFLSEVFPKVIARSEPVNYAQNTIYLVNIIFLFIHPFSLLVQRIVKFRGKRENVNTSKSVETLSDAIERASDIISDEEDILKGIVKFGNMDVSEIIQPRVNVVAVDFNNSLTQIFAVVVDSEYSRIPVFSGNFDNIRGILYVKDLLPFLHEKDNFRWQTLIRPTYFVPETKKVKELLSEFQTNKIHMSVVVDEYGGVLGIVTLEDILEEIVGEISDESDKDERPYAQINENTFIFDGKTLLNDFYKVFSQAENLFEEMKGEADTLAGLILEMKGEIPGRDESILIGNFSLRVESADPRRIQQIRVTVLANDKK